MIFVWMYECGHIWFCVLYCKMIKYIRLHITLPLPQNLTKKNFTRKCSCGGKMFVGCHYFELNQTLKFMFVIKDIAQGLVCVQSNWQVLCMGLLRRISSGIQHINTALLRWLFYGYSDSQNYELSSTQFQN